MWKALVYTTLITMMHTVLGDNWAVRLRCLWARPCHCRRARAAVSLHLSIICRKENDLNSTMILTDWSTRLHFPTVWDRHISCLLYLKTLFCACELQSQGGGGFELVNCQGRFPRDREFKDLTSELHFLSYKPRTARHFVWSVYAVVPKVCFAVPKGFATSLQEIRG